MNTTRQRFIAYSDGSCDNLNPQRPGGSAYIILDISGTEIKRMSKGFMHTTNNRMEMLAIISIVNSLPSNSFVTINTDSEYCIKALLSHCPEKNLDLVALYHKIVKEKSIIVEFQHVRGHSGIFYNEECDRMAREKYNEMLATHTPTKKTKGKKRKTKKRKKMVKMIARVDTEIYKDNDLFCCDFLGDDTNISDGSGYSIAAKTAEVCAEAVKQYILNIFKNETDRK